MKRCSTSLTWKDMHIMWYSFLTCQIGKIKTFDEQIRREGEGVGKQACSSYIVRGSIIDRTSMTISIKIINSHPLT